MKKNITFFILFVLITSLVFHGLFNTFYQQDEWHALGKIQASRISYITTDSSIANTLLLENRPFARIANFILFGFFPLNIKPLFIFTIIFHSLNAFLVYKIALRLGLRNVIAIFTSLFFLLNASGKQAVLWFGTVTGTLPSATGILLAIYFYLRFLDDKKKSQSLAIFAVFFLFLSFGFKEAGLFLFLLLPAAELTKNIIEKKKLLLTTPSIVLAVIAVVVFMIKFASVYFFPGTATRYINTDTAGGLIRLAWNAITYPIESFSQILVPSEVMFPLSRRITEYVFSYFETSGYAGLISEIIVVEFVSVIFSFAIIIPLVLLWSKRKEKWPLYFAILFYLLSFIPYLVLIKPNGYLESRYYYLAVVPVAFLIGISLQDFFDKSKKIIQKRNAYAFMRIVIFALIGLYFVMHVRFIHDQLDFLKERGNTQKYILAEILKEHPRLEAKQVFYIESDHSFIVANNPLPFQNGIGYTLLVTYVGKAEAHEGAQFLNDKFFWLLGSQGYLERGEHGFGFFTDIQKLKKHIASKKFNKDAVAAFRYDSVANKISNITSEVQKRLE